MRIAAALIVAHCDRALGRAEIARDAAWRRRDIVRADLFVAVCAIIRWRMAAATLEASEGQEPCR